MTKTFTVYAWCVRPFISYLDEVEAETPEDAIALARRQPEKLLDAADECNGQYPWDEFAARDEDGRELLRVRDTESRVREAAPALLETLEEVRDTLSDRQSPDDEEEDHLLALIDDVIAKATAE